MKPPSHRLVATTILLLSTLHGRAVHGSGCPRILAFAGYGTPTQVQLSGRVLMDPPLAPPDPRRGGLYNIADTIGTLETDEVCGARVLLQLAGRSYRATTNDDGVWSIAARGLKPPLRPGVVRAVVRLSVPKSCSAAREALIYIAPDAVGTAVVSDFDDTVVQSRVTNKLRLIAEVLTKNPAQLVAVPGVSSAYQAAHRAGAVLFFYVSGSPQNLYERITQFLALKGLPAGPVLLKNIGEDPLLAQEGYKQRRIEHLLEFFPRLRFVLIGDSGERDPEVYRGLRERHPTRVAGIVIRTVADSDTSQKRLVGMTALPDFAKNTDAIAELVRSGSASKSDVP